MFKSSVMAASKTGPQCSPPVDCKECPAGVVPRVVKGGCVGCPECCPVPECDPIRCAPGYISQQAVLSNGCKGCNQCVLAA